MRFSCLFWLDYFLS